MLGAALQPNTPGSAHLLLKEVFLTSSAGSALKESQEPWELCFFIRLIQIFPEAFLGAEIVVKF